MKFSKISTLFGCFASDRFELVYEIVQVHGSDKHWDSRLLSEKPCYRIKTPLVVGGTRTQVLADSMAIAASVLNHCAT